MGDAVRIMHARPLRWAIESYAGWRDGSRAWTDARKRHALGVADFRAKPRVTRRAVVYPNDSGVRDPRGRRTGACARHCSEPSRAFVASHWLGCIWTRL